MNSIKFVQVESFISIYSLDRDTTEIQSRKSLFTDFMHRKIYVRVYVFHLPSTIKICLKMKQNIFVMSMHKRFFDIFETRCFDIFDTIFLGLRRISFFALYLFPVEICVKCRLWSCTISAEWGLKHFMNTSRYKPVLFKTLLPITLQ